MSVPGRPAIVSCHRAPQAVRSNMDIKGHLEVLMLLEAFPHEKYVLAFEHAKQSWLHRRVVGAHDSGRRVPLRNAAVVQHHTSHFKHVDLEFELCEYSHEAQKTVL